MYLIAVDPGQQTGLAIVRLSGGDDWFEAHEEPWLDAVHRVHTFLRASLAAHVVTERFVITREAAQQSRQTDALRAIGALQFLTSAANRVDPIPFHELNRSDRTRVTSAHLRALGFWHRGGAGHANDAARHAVVALLRFHATSPIAQRCASVLAGDVTDGGNEDGTAATGHTGDRGTDRS